MNRSLFGIEGYKIPNTDLLNYRPRTTKMSKCSAPHFIDQITKQKNFMPGPNYNVTIDWTKTLKNKGKFTSSPRVTFT